MERDTHTRMYYIQLHTEIVTAKQKKSDRCIGRETIDINSETVNDP